MYYVYRIDSVGDIGFGFCQEASKVGNGFDSVADAAYTIFGELMGSQKEYGGVQFCFSPPCDFSLPKETCHYPQRLEALDKFEQDEFVSAMVGLWNRHVETSHAKNR